MASMGKVAGGAAFAAACLAAGVAIGFVAALLRPRALASYVQAHHQPIVSDDEHIRVETA